MEAKQRLTGSRGTTLLALAKVKLRSARPCRSLDYTGQPTHLKRLVDVSIVIHHLSLAGFTLGALKKKGRGVLSQSLGQEGPEARSPQWWCLCLPGHRVA